VISKTTAITPATASHIPAAKNVGSDIDFDILQQEKNKTFRFIKQDGCQMPKYADDQCCHSDFSHFTILVTKFHYFAAHFTTWQVFVRY
jgi:hypothetical protein